MTVRMGWALRFAIVSGALCVLLAGCESSPGNGTGEADVGADAGSGGGGDDTGTSGATCGNGAREAGEACDDGNLDAGDGCDEQCRVEGGACSSDSDCSSGQVCTEGACEAAPPECVVDSDCDAGYVCAAGACEPAPPECVVDSDCDAGYVCAAGTCEPAPPECVVDSDCDAGYVCVAGACEPAPPECVIDSDCDAGEVCVAGTCEPAPPECVIDSDCDAGYVCVANACEPAPPECVIDSDCDAGYVCVANACEPAPPECVIDTDCDAGYVCVANACEPAPPECVIDTDCDAGYVCVANACEPAPPECVIDSDCDAGCVCAAGACEPAPPECVIDSDCDAGEVCVAGTCEPAPPECVIDTDCDAGYVCVANACEPAPPECVIDSDCDAGYVCVANACEPAPPECVIDSDCDAGYVCVANACEAAPPECVIDSDCDAGEVCVAGTCEPAPPECVIDTDCDAGYVCVANACEPAPPECVIDTDCDAGYVCVANACEPAPPECVIDTDCDAGYVCVAGACEPAPPECVIDSDCDAGYVCVAGTCEPAPFLALTIYDLQDVDSVGHPAVDTDVLLAGVVVTAVDRFGGGQGSLFVQEVSGGPYSGVFCYNPGGAIAVDLLAPGDVVDVTGTYAEYNGLTEVVLLSVTRVDVPRVPIAPALVSADEIRTGGANAEAYEGVLVEVNDVVVTDANPDGPVSDYGEFVVADALRVDDNLYAIAPDPVPGDAFVRLAGVLHFANDDHKLLPRDADDVVALVISCDPACAADACEACVDGQCVSACVDGEVCVAGACEPAPPVTLTIYDLQDVDSANHPAEDTDVLLEGVVVTAVDRFGGGRGSLFVQEVSGGPYSGVFCYNPGGAIDVDLLAPGDVVDVTGTYAEYNGLTEVVLLSVTTVDVPSVTIAPALVSADEIQTGGANAEAYEGVLVEVNDVVVTDANPDGPASDYGEFVVADVLRVDDNLYAIDPDPVLGDAFVRLAGVLHFANDDHKLLPRDADDVAALVSSCDPACAADACEACVDGQCVSACVDGESCVAGVCEPVPPECVVDADCDQTEICTDGVCEVAPPASCPDDDRFEPNDTIDTATPIVAGFLPGLARCGDSDYYAIEVCAGGTLTVDAYFVHADGDIDIELRSLDEVQIGLSQSSSDNEQLSWTNDSVDAPATVFLRVYFRDNTYDLDVAIDGCAVN